MRPVILYRESRETMTAPELAAARRHFPCTDSRMHVMKDDLVIGRYSVLPFYKELCQDVSFSGGVLVNSHRQHEYVAQLADWYMDLHDLTPMTWFRWEDVPDRCGPSVVKGSTNSRKFDWRTHMFAKDKREAGDVAWRLGGDALIGPQDICFREFVKLRTYMIGLQDMPVTEEYRFFCLDGQVLCGAYYWSNYVDDLPEKPDPSRVPESFLQKVLERIGKSVRFVVVDVGIKEDGSPVVVELNDGQMSGLSENDPEILYSRLREVLGG